MASGVLLLTYPILLLLPLTSSSPLPHFLLLLLTSTSSPSAKASGGLVKGWRAPRITSSP